MRKDYFGNGEIISSIYFGGGTPSLVSESELASILQNIYKHYNVLPDAEITLEANPDDLSTSKLKMLKNAGINRLSIGVQSFSDDSLKFMNRTHSSKEAIKAIGKSIDAGFENISVDLIYGLPEMTLSKWENTIATAFELPLHHISCYNLTVENHTLLKKWVMDKKIVLPDDTDVVKQFNLLSSLASNNGFVHYEISNLAKPNFESRHNSSYWKNMSYLGIGPSAHSYNGSVRQWNIKSNKAYIDSIENKKLNFEKEITTPDQRFNEFIMTRLRTKHGFNEDELGKIIPSNYIREFNLIFNRYIKSEHARKHDGQYQLTIDGWMICDKITSELFL